MMNNISCHKGRCYEIKKPGYSDFNNLFDDENIVQSIEKDIWKDNMYGKRRYYN